MESLISAISLWNNHILSTLVLLVLCLIPACVTKILRLKTLQDKLGNKIPHGPIGLPIIGN